MNTLMREPTVGTDASVLALTRVFEAPAAAVFDQWTDATRIKEWWHPKEFTTPEFELDFRVGGSYCYCIRSKGHDGWAHGRFREIAVPNRIVMTFQWESGDPAHDAGTLTTVAFEPEGDEQTRLTFRQEPFRSEAEHHSHGQGWSQVLDAFARTLVDARA